MGRGLINILYFAVYRRVTSRAQASAVWRLFISVPDRVTNNTTPHRLALFTVHDTRDGLGGPLTQLA